eukprot:2306762-Rhodomonas_salina.1
MEAVRRGDVPLLRSLLEHKADVGGEASSFSGGSSATVATASMYECVRAQRWFGTRKDRFRDIVGCVQAVMDEREVLALLCVGGLADAFAEPWRRMSAGDAAAAIST